MEEFFLKYTHAYCTHFASIRVGSPHAALSPTEKTVQKEKRKHLRNTFASDSRCWFCWYICAGM